MKNSHQEFNLNAQIYRADLLYACEEALGSGCIPDLQYIVENYLTAHGLSAKLYNQRFTRHDMSSERFDDTLVLRVSFRDFESEEVNLFLAQSLLYHYLERHGDVARARTADVLPFAEARPFYNEVASVMTRVVWTAVINRKLCDLGFNELVQRDAKRRAAELRAKYKDPYVEPSFQDFDDWVAYLVIAQTAVELAPAARDSLLAATTRVAPRSARRARAAISAMEAFEFDNLESIREALIRVHDAHENILGSVSIFDPVTRQQYGFGLQLEDLGVMAIKATQLGTSEAEGPAV